jgi:hypothetical protein
LDEILAAAPKSPKSPKSPKPEPAGWWENYRMDWRKSRNAWKDSEWENGAIL